MKTLNIIGLMSGTSLDGLDIALIQFKQQKQDWSFEITEAETIEYTPEWRNRLSFVKAGEDISGKQLVQLEAEYSKLLANKVLGFLNKKKLPKTKINFIASHGHTLYHNPVDGYTKQIGSGAILSALSGIDCYTDFRTADVVLGGQGAPLVPIGDQLLFKNFEACLNLGGFANFSFMQRQNPLAFDVCAVNTLLNAYAEKLGFPYDDNGNLAKSGKVNPPLLDALALIPFYKKPAPKSLGEEWVNETLKPILAQHADNPKNTLATLTEHMATEIANVLNIYKPKQVLITGGGAYNQHLIHQITKKTNTLLVLPNSKIIEYKEALIFAFLGALAVNNRTNVLSSITGAKMDHIAGNFHKAPNSLIIN